MQRQTVSLERCQRSRLRADKLCSRLWAGMWCMPAATYRLVQLCWQDSRQQNVHGPLLLLAMATHLSGVHSGKLLLAF